jgi:hypothetical protein
MTLAGWIGVWMLVLGCLLMVAEVLWVLPLALGVRRRALALQDLAFREEGAGRAELALLRRLLEESDLALRPYRRLRRWLAHPLVPALLESYRRRRRRP